jgi:hypothetical protein
MIRDISVEVFVTGWTAGFESKTGRIVFVHRLFCYQVDPWESFPMSLESQANHLPSFVADSKT